MIADDVHDDLSCITRAGKEFNSTRLRFVDLIAALDPILPLLGQLAVHQSTE